MKYSLPLNNFSRSLLDNLTSVVSIAIGSVSWHLTCMFTKDYQKFGSYESELGKVYDRGS